MPHLDDRDRQPAPRCRRSHPLLPTRVTALTAATLLTCAGCIDPTSDRDLDTTVELAAPRAVGVDAERLRAAPDDDDIRPAIPRMLTVEDAIEIAMSRDPAIRRALEQVAIARARLAARDRAPNPMVEFGIGVPVDGLSGAPAIAMFAQQITWLWTRPARLDAADARRRAAILDAADAVIALDAEVRRRHAEAVAAIRLADIAAEDAAAAATLRRLTDRRAEEGEATRIDVARARLAVETAELDAVARRDAARTARLTLVATIGLPDADPESFTPVPGDAADAAPPPDDSRIVELAASARLDVAAAVCRLEAAAADADLAGLSRIPEVSATLMWNRNFMDREAVLPGLRLSLPIFDDGEPAVAEAAAAWRDAALACIEARRTGVAEARLALDAWHRASILADGVEASVLTAARDAERLEDAAHREGTSSLDAAIEARRRRLLAERAVIDHRLDAELALIDLVQAVGGDLHASPRPPLVPAIETARLETTETRP